MLVVVVPTDGRREGEIHTSDGKREMEKRNTTTLSKKGNNPKGERKKSGQ
jgi:hypothetical protein